MSDVFNQLYYVDVVLSAAGANSQGNTVIIPKTDLDLTTILAGGKCRSDYADVSLAYKDNGGYTELDRQIWSPQYNWGGIKFDLVDDIVNIPDYRVYYGESGLTVPNKADPANVGYWSDDCNEDQSYTLNEGVGAASSFTYSVANKNFTCSWVKDSKYSRRRMLLPLTLDFSTDWHLEFLYNVTTKQNSSFGFAGLYNTAKATNIQDCLGFSINVAAAGGSRGTLRYYNSAGVHTLLNKVCGWVLGQDYRVRIEHDVTSTTLTAQVWNCVGDAQLQIFTVSTAGKNIVLNCIGPGMLDVAGGQTITGISDNICVQSWRERIDGLLVVSSVGAEQNNPATSSDEVVFSDSDNRVYTGRGSSLDEFKLGDSNNSGFYIFGSCLDGIKLSDVVIWFKPPGPAPWHGWEEDVGVELELEKMLLVYVNFEEYTRAGIVDSKFFQSYLKMDEDLTSNLVKKIDDGTFIKMN